MKLHAAKQVDSPILRVDPNIRIQELHKENEAFKSEILQLKRSIVLLEQRNYDMLKSEIQYRSVIKSYRIELKKKAASGVLSDINEKISSSIVDSHRELTDNISKLHQRVDEIINNREEVLVAVYDSKLKAINKNLEKEKKEKFEHLEGLAEREHMLNKELQMLKGSVGVIEAKNSHLEKENKEIKHLMKVRDLEISELEKRMFEFKQSSLKLPSIKSAKNLEIASPSQKTIKTCSMAIETDAVEDDTSMRYQKVISKLQKLLMIEKNNVRAARNAYFRELNSRSEIEDTIVGCIEEVKRERNAKKGAFQLSYNMSITEKLVHNETILKKLHEFMAVKEVPSDHQSPHT